MLGGSNGNDNVPVGRSSSMNYEMGSSLRKSVTTNFSAIGGSIAQEPQPMENLRKTNIR